ncbi:MAG TPA: CHAP domain-containing protein [Candidatus Dormibacteraeota bacterium]|jgi:surface antigen
MKKITALLVAAIAAGVVSMPVSPAYAASPDGPAALLAKVDALNNQIEQANGKVDAANRKLSQDQKLEAALNVQIAALARLQYKRPALVVQFFEAGSVSQVLADITNDRLMAGKQRNFLLQARELRHQDQVARDSAATSLASLVVSRDEAKKVADQAVAQRNAELAERARAIAAAAAASPSTPISWSGSGPYPNRFAYGYCTWYVANRRFIPWLGNAIDWWPNARAYGQPEGQLPRVGAVMVTRESSYGHVAYVESVNGDGSWVVSEMNFIGWNRVSTRVIHPGQVPLVGFIY